MNIVNKLTHFNAGGEARPLTAAKDGPIVYGHHHLNVTSVDEHRKFWTTIGGTAIKIGVDNDREIIRFPNVLVFMTARPPKGGAEMRASTTPSARAARNLAGTVSRFFASSVKSKVPRKATSKFL